MFLKVVACHKQKMFVKHLGQTDERYAWQAKFQMFAKQGLPVWPGLNVSSQI